MFLNAGMIKSYYLKFVYGKRKEREEGVGGSGATLGDSGTGANSGAIG